MNHYQSAGIGIFLLGLLGLTVYLESRTFDPSRPITEKTANGQASEGAAVIDMPKSLGAKKWHSEATRNYWLRFPDNTFARIEFRMIAGGDHFAVIGGYRNPSATVRNLEPKLRE